MSAVGATGPSRRDPIMIARRQAAIRFATGTTIAFILCEAMGWYPTFLAPILLATLLVNLPTAPSLKAGLALVVVMAGASLLAFVVTSLLRGVPHILFGVIGLLIYFALLAMAQARAQFPALLLLINLAVIPVVIMIAPAQAGSLPIAMTRAMAVAVVVLIAMWAFWPQAAPPPPAPAPAAGPVASPYARALVGTAIVMPVMLVYLLFGLADALPVLVTTVILVTTFDPRKGALQGAAMILANVIGGLIAVIVYMLLGMAPSLIALAFNTFLVALAVAVRIDRGGMVAAIAALTFNSSMIILSSAIAAGPSNSGIWLARVFQFGLACAFTIGMMSLAWARKGSDEESR